MINVVEVGDRAPNFKALDQNGNEMKLSDFRGKDIVLYFYPKDDTPGCTVEACAFRDDLEAFNDIKAKVIGVSTDNIESHKRFERKHNLNFTLLADDKKEISKKYGVLGMLGKASRTTFLIDRDGIIRHIFQKVRPDSHSEEVMEKLKELELVS